MSPPASEPETHRLLPRFRQDRTDIVVARRVAADMIETGRPIPKRAPKQRDPGDAHKLRGIPVVGVPGGLGGAIPDTSPGRSRELDEWKGRSRSRDQPLTNE